MAKQTVEIEFIDTEAAYRRALKRLATFFDTPPKAGAREDTEFRLLMLMVEKYESSKYALPSPDPVAAIAFAVEQRGLAATELQSVLGSRQRVHDILRRKRRLTLTQIRNLNQKFRVPAEVLIRDYPLYHPKR
jgi:HTH-type transcriptional regulator/antitoxin HigA